MHEYVCVQVSGCVWSVVCVPSVAVRVAEETGLYGHTRSAAHTATYINQADYVYCILAHLVSGVLQRWLALVYL